MPPIVCGAGASKMVDNLAEKDIGGRKFDSNKLRFDLIPVEPLQELARVYTIGAKKYGDRNWENGLSWSRLFAAMMRHAWKFWMGERNDPEDGQHMSLLANPVMGEAEVIAIRACLEPSAPGVLELRRRVCFPPFPEW